MATIEIHDATVKRIIDGYGFMASETFKLRNGEEATRWYTVWTKSKFEVGESVRIKGDLTVKLDEYTGRDNQPKTGIAVHVNNAVCSLAVDAPF